MGSAFSASVVVVGGGPVGLLLGCRLADQGIRCGVLERRAEPSRRTRAIGVHPPALERFAELGLADQLIACGCRVRIGRVCRGARELGRLRLDRAPGPFNFVLTAPQYEIERILREHLQQQGADLWRPGVEVTEITQADEAVQVRGTSAGAPVEWRAAFVVGCDGKDSLVRNAAGLGWSGGAYADTFVMGDFSDATGWGDEARIIFAPDGFVESFPLPGRVRRWVASFPHAGEAPAPELFREHVRQRAATDPGAAVSDLTAFGVQHFLADSFTAGRIALAGDAAHVMSPIGGQGMNVGWLDAWDLAAALSEALAGGAADGAALRRYGEHARRRAARALRRAGINLAIGRSGWGGLRDAVVAVALHLPGQSAWARYFTMRGL